MTESGLSDPESAVTVRNPWLRIALLGAIFLIGVGLRLHCINEPLFDAYPERQYRSAMIARSYYWAGLSGIEPWRREIERINLEKEGVLEPPLMEHLAAVGYRISGGEFFWIPRAVSITFWLIAGVGIYFLARRLAGTDAALISTAVFVLHPFGVYFSRCFMPDSLMIMLQVLGLLAIVRYFEARTWGRILTAAGISALAMFVQPKCVFMIFAGYGALALAEIGVRRVLIDLRSWAFAAIAVAPTALWYVGGIMTGNQLQSQAGWTFVPGTIVKPFFWGGWLMRVQDVAGLLAPACAAVGTFFFARRSSRALMLGLWAGYVLFGLVFSFHIRTHDYYQLQLLIVIALALGALGATALRRAADLLQSPAWARVVVTGLVLTGLALSVGSYMLKRREISERMTPPSEQRTYAFLSRLDPDLTRLVSNAREIGEAVHHSQKTLFLHHYDTNGYKYHGEVAAEGWPRTAMLRAETGGGGAPQT